MKFPFQLIELTHTLDENSPAWDESCGFSSSIVLDYIDCTSETSFRVSICIGDEDEYWEDIKASLKPCADWMLQEINTIKLSINPNKIAYRVNE